MASKIMFSGEGMVFKNLVQKVLLIVVLLWPIQSSFGQLKTDPVGILKTDGPINVKSGTMVKIAITGLEGLQDPKIVCYPESGEWFAGRDFSGNNPIILFFPNKDNSGKTYTFVIAGNKDNKTLLTAHTVVVDGGVPVPPPDIPIIPGKYTDQLRSAYMVSPDEESLDKLIGVYDAIATQAKDVTSYKQLWEVLAAATSKTLNDPSRTKLVGVRDKIADILQADLANRDSMPYDAAKCKKVFTDLSNSLKPLKAKKGVQ